MNCNWTTIASAVTIFSLIFLNLVFSREQKKKIKPIILQHNVHYQTL